MIGEFYGGLDLAFDTSADVSAGRIAALSSADSGTAETCTSANSARAVGVFMEDAESGEVVHVRLQGIAHVCVAESVSAGDLLCAGGADGKARKAVAGVNTVLGRALSSSATDGYVPVMLLSLRQPVDDTRIARAKATYDFATLGGAVGSIAMGVSIPAGSMVRAVVMEEETNVTSEGSATVQLKAGTTNLTAATAIADIPALGTVALPSSATAVKITAESELTLAVAVADLTAGKVNVYVEYYLA